MVLTKGASSTKLSWAHCLPKSMYSQFSVQLSNAEVMDAGSCISECCLVWFALLADIE